MAERRVYARPPIQEAICQVTYIEREPQDLRRLDHFLSLIPAEYSGPVGSVFTMQPQAQAAAFGVTASMSLSLNVTGPNLQIPSVDQSRLITLSRDGIAVHSRAPYCGWEKLLPDVLSAHQAFVGVFSPAAVNRVAVRYVNRIEIPLTTLEPSDYFVGLPSLATRGNLALSGIFSRLEGAIPTTTHRFAITFASTLSPPGSTAFVLDIEVNHALAAPDNGPELMPQVMEQVRSEERDLFEASITDRARSLFEK